MDGNEAAVHMRYQGRVVALEQRQVGLERRDRSRVLRCGHGDGGWLGMQALRNGPTVDEVPARQLVPSWTCSLSTLCKGLQMSSHLVAVNCLDNFQP